MKGVITAASDRPGKSTKKHRQAGTVRHLNNQIPFLMSWPALTLFILQLCSLSASAQQPEYPDRLDINPAGRQLTDRLGSSIEWQGFQPGPATTDADQSISLKNRQYAKVIQKTPLSGQKGSLSLWIKPDWNPAEESSHTLLTLPWQDGKNGYMALSMGWWEPEYAKKLIFIVNNEESIACHTDSQLMQKTWNMITVVWDHTKGCRLYIDGDRQAERKLPFSGNYRSADTLLVGSDKGSTVVRGRTADFNLGSLSIWSEPLTDNDVHELYSIQSARYQGLAAEKAAWFTPSKTVPVPTVQNRALFDESAEWALSEAHMQKLLNRMQRAGLNIYIPNVWHGHGTHYPTSVTDMDPAVRKISRTVDPLLILIQAAHGKGIEVHPWFTVVRREDDKMPRYYAKGVPDLAYDVHNTDFRRFIVDLMLDMVRRYPVDGINLDYIRAMGICDSLSCQQNYSSTTGRNLTRDLNAINRDDPEAKAAIREWQDIAVTDIVERFATEARKIRPKLIISVDGEPQLDPTKRNLEGRDELTWARAGLIDIIYNMDYRQRPDVEKINALMTQSGIQHKIIQIFGNYDQRDGKVIPRDGQQIKGYGNYANTHWGNNGLSIYLAAAFTEEQANALGQGPFRTPAQTSWSANRH